jgi:hypothetical protein
MVSVKRHFEAFLTAIYQQMVVCEGIRTGVEIPHRSFGGMTQSCGGTPHEKG